MENIIIDVENCIAGRSASVVAKELLKGKRVKIVNAEKAVISGDPKNTVNIFKQRIERGDPYKGPFYPKDPDRILKRMIRGMLPYKKPMGKRAFKGLRVYVSVPEDIKDMERIKGVESKLHTFITLEKLSARL